MPTWIACGRLWVWVSWKPFCPVDGDERVDEDGLAFAGDEVEVLAGQVAGVLSSHPGAPGMACSRC